MFFVDKQSGLYSLENFYGENGVEVDAPLFLAGAYSVTPDGEVVLSSEYSGGRTIGLTRYEP